jgi:hypothetical protein
MFNSVKDPLDDATYFGELEDSAFGDYLEAPPPRDFLGMSAGQRFVVSLILLGTVVVVGLLCLLVTEKVLLF